MIAKVILIGKAIGLSPKTTSRTLARSVLRASLAYGALVAVFAILEHVIEGLIHGKTLGASLEAFWGLGSYELLGRALLMFVAFIPFFAFWEMARVLGEKKIFGIFRRRGVPTEV